MSVTRTLRTTALAAVLATGALAAGAPQSSAATIGDGDVAVTGGRIADSGATLDLTVTVTCTAGETHTVLAWANQDMTESVAASDPVACTGAAQDVTVSLAAMPTDSPWRPGTAYAGAWLTDGTAGDPLEEITIA
ncbi:hypothetical protein [Kitasatospora sp. NPDC059571]|uniref:hypothetical protein n=1 Tax=Kitasatospora sp. NPDC059571 TaxID=3346871 RepID=UPI00368AD589